jgi:outer membrane protein
LPPTLNLQYHLPLKNFIPYIGAGVNYTFFYGVKDDAASLSYKNNVGFSTQAGFDYNLSSKWFLNVDVKKIFLKSDVTVKGDTPTVLSGVKINPFIVGIGVGVRL